MIIVCITADVETTFEVNTGGNVDFPSITISHRTSSSVDLVGLQVRLAIRPNIIFYETITGLAWSPPAL